MFRFQPPQTPRESLHTASTSSHRLGHLRPASGPTPTPPLPWARARPKPRTILPPSTRCRPETVVSKLLLMDLDKPLTCCDSVEVSVTAPSRELWGSTPTNGKSARSPRRDHLADCGPSRSPVYHQTPTSSPRSPPPLDPSGQEEARRERRRRHRGAKASRNVVPLSLCPWVSTRTGRRRRIASSGKCLRSTTSDMPGGL